MEITEFLLARIEEDESYANAAGGGVWDALDGGVTDLVAKSWPVCDTEVPGGVRGNRATRVHIANHDPARVLRECEAKRKIMGPALGFRAAAERMHGEDLLGSIRKDAAEMMAAAAEDALRPLAAVYSDHPDYDPEWAA